MSQILIIDDDRTFRLTLSRLLKKQGFEVKTADNGKMGLAEAELHPPAVIICDWMMPEMDGLDVCRCVRQSPNLANTYFILLTSRDEEQDIVQGLETGADDFLPKPPRPEELKARVRAGLRLYSANYELQKQKRLLEEELTQASEYVRSLLPSDMGDSAVQILTKFIPSAQLGGDCFDFFWADADHLVVYLLDVSGHGVGPALLSVSVLNLLRTRCLLENSMANSSTNFLDPKSVLHDLNQTFQMAGHREMYFTIWYGVYQVSTGQLHYASGGHPPAILIKPDQVLRLKTPHLPIGMLPDLEYVNASCEISQGDRLYIFSDGVFEIDLPNGEIIGLNKLVELLADGAAGSQMETLVQRLSSLAGTTKFGDDFSLLEIMF